MHVISHLRNFSYIYKMNKKLYIPILLLLSLLACVSCTREDDIEDIYEGKVWYMNGGTINGMRMNSEVKNFYTQDGKSVYFISFGPDTFNGMLSKGINFSGTWTANGKSQTLSLTFKQVPDASSPFDKKKYNILRSAIAYKSGATFLEIRDSQDNAVMFGSER